MENDIRRAASKISAFRSHKIGSRNLDMGVSGDFGGDVPVKLLVMNRALGEISGISRTLDGVLVPGHCPSIVK